MGRNAHPGLALRSGTWHIDKRLGRGKGRLRESCQTSDIEEAKRYLVRRLEEIREATVYGVRPTRTFRQAATRFLTDNAHRKGVARDAQDLSLVEPYIGDMPLHTIHQGTLEKFIRDRKREGRADGTINRTLATVRNVLTCAADLWRDENGLSWLDRPPRIVLLPDSGKRIPYPIDGKEQRLLLPLLPRHLRKATWFAANTGLREDVICQLRWSWELKLPPPCEGISVFLIPGSYEKNAESRILVLNRIAKRVIEGQRGQHPERVFTYKGEPLNSLYNSAWKRVRSKAAKRYQKRIGSPCPPGFAKLRFHDLRHTFGSRLRDADVSLEDRAELLGHKNRSVTRHYSAAHITRLIGLVERIDADNVRKLPAVNVNRLLAWAVTA